MQAACKTQLRTTTTNLKNNTIHKRQGQKQDGWHPGDENILCKAVLDEAKLAVAVAEAVVVEVEGEQPVLLQLVVKGAVCNKKDLTVVYGAHEVVMVMASAWQEWERENKTQFGILFLEFFFITLCFTEGCCCASWHLIKMIFLFCFSLKITGKPIVSPPSLGRRRDQDKIRPVLLQTQAARVKHKQTKEQSKRMNKKKRQLHAHTHIHMGKLKYLQVSGSFLGLRVKTKMSWWGFVAVGNNCQVN